MSLVTEFVRIATRKIEKHSPEILVAVGIVTIGASIVSAYTAAKKVDDILEEYEEEKEKIEDTFEKHPEKYSEEDKANDLRITKVQTGVKIVGAIAPTVALAAGGVASILGANDILHSRFGKLAAQYATLDRVHRAYREQVKDEIGDDKENMIHSNAERIYSHPYEFFFDEGSRHWEDSADLNKRFLDKILVRANEYYDRHGFLYLETVLDWLDIPISSEKREKIKEVGWLKSYGDDYIDFGLHRYSKALSNFYNGTEPVVLLQFNVFGALWAIA